MSISFKKTLKSNGYSASEPRKLVFDYLRSHDNVSTNDLIDNLKDNINQASIYRSLQVFRKLGIAHDDLVGGKKVIELSDDFKPHHHHISCVACGEATCIKDADIERRLHDLATEHGFRHISHQLGINGYCRNCQGGEGS